MKEKIQYWLEVEIIDDATGKQLYAGNYDEVTSCTLTGCGNDRYGAEQGEKNHEEIVVPLLEEAGVYLEDMFETFSHEEYGMVRYSLGEVNYNYCRFKVSKYVAETDEFKKYVEVIRNLKFPNKRDSWSDKEPITIRIGRIFLTRNVIRTENIQL